MSIASTTVGLTVSITLPSEKIEQVVLRDKDCGRFWTAAVKNGSRLHFVSLDKGPLSMPPDRISKLSVSVLSKERGLNDMISNATNATLLSFAEPVEHLVSVAFPQLCDPDHDYRLEINTVRFPYQGKVTRKLTSADLAEPQKQLHDFFLPELEKLFSREAKIKKYIDGKWEAGLDRAALSRAIVMEISNNSNMVGKGSQDEATGITEAGFARIFHNVIEEQGYHFDDACEGFSKTFVQAAISIFQDEIALA